MCDKLYKKYRASLVAQWDLPSAYLKLDFERLLSIHRDYSRTTKP